MQPAAVELVVPVTTFQAIVAGLPKELIVTGLAEQAILAVAFVMRFRPATIGQRNATLSPDA